MYLFSAFTDNVWLRNFTSKCFGDVYVVVNGAEYGVCYPDLSQDLLHQLGKVVCRELGCGEVKDVKKGSFIRNNGLLSNVECQGDEKSLWHCLARHEHKSCDATRVTCSGN